MTEPDSSLAGSRGESPATLSYLQVILAHAIVLGGALFFLGLWYADSGWPRSALLWLAALCSLASIRWVLRLPRLDPHEATALVATATAVAAAVALALAGGS